MTKKCASHVFSIPRPQKCGSWAKTPSWRGLGKPVAPVATCVLERQKPAANGSRAGSGSSAGGRRGGQHHRQQRLRAQRGTAAGLGSAERHSAAAPAAARQGSTRQPRGKAAATRRSYAAPAAARQRRQRVSAGFSCVFFFWRGFAEDRCFRCRASCLCVLAGRQEERTQPTTRAAPLAAPKETGRSTGGNPRSRRPRRHHRGTRRTRESRSPAPARGPAAMAARGNGRQPHRHRRNANAREAARSCAALQQRQHQRTRSGQALDRQRRQPLLAPAH